MPTTDPNTATTTKDRRTTSASEGRPRTDARERASVPSEALNLAIVVGVCSTPPEQKVLPSGAAVVNLSVTTDGGARGATSVPVVCWAAPSWVDTLEPGDGVVVVGRMRRRFWRAPNGALGSRTELEADAIGRPRDRRARARLARRVAEAAASIEA